MVYLDGLQGENPDETIYATPEGNEFHKSLLKAGVPSGYFVPLIHHGEAIAVMQLTKFTALPLKAQAADRLEAVSIQLGAAVQKIANCQ